MSLDDPYDRYHWQVRPAAMTRSCLCCGGHAPAGLLSTVIPVPAFLPHDKPLGERITTFGYLCLLCREGVRPTGPERSIGYFNPAVGKPSCCFPIH